MKMKMSEESFDDLIRELKYKYCNYLGECGECSNPCYCKIPLKTILAELKAERKRKFVDVEPITEKEQIIHELEHPDLQNEKRYGFHGGIMYAKEVVERYLK